MLHGVRSAQTWQTCVCSPHLPLTSVIQTSGNNRSADLNSSVSPLGCPAEGREKQVSMFLYCMSEDAEDTLLSTGIMSEESKQYQTVVDKFGAFFKVRHNVIFKRAKFNCCVQEENEAIEQFITSLYSLAETCDYENLMEEMICDRTVIDVCDYALSERLQTIADLILEKGKTAIHQRAVYRNNNKC